MNAANPTIDTWREAQGHHQAGCAFLTRGGPKCPKCIRQDAEAVEEKKREQRPERDHHAERRDTLRKDRKAQEDAQVAKDMVEFEALATCITRQGLAFVHGALQEAMSGAKPNHKLRRDVLTILRLCKASNEKHPESAYFTDHEAPTR